LPRKSLVAQLSETFVHYGIEHTVLMAGEHYIRQIKCKIISIDTYMSRMQSGRMEFIPASVLCIDEAHSQHSPKKIELFNQYPIICGFTATPSVSKKIPLNKVYSKIVYALSMKELIKLKKLLPFKYFSPSIFHPDNIKIDSDGEFNSRELDEFIDSKLKDEEGNAMLVGDVFKNWEKIASDRQTVVFCKTQAHARALVNEFVSHGVGALYIDCRTEMPERKDIFNAITTGKSQVIVNVNIVSMGVDIPILSCTVLATPINKIHRYHQAAGRSSRPYKDQTESIIIDHCGTIAKLGFVEDEQYWDLDGKETPEERKKKAKEELKEPKILTCPECNQTFSGRRICPYCQFEMIPKGEAVPVHEAEMVEIKVSKIKPADKQNFYAQLLFIAKDKKYKRGWADFKFKEKFGAWPAKKNGITPIPPTQEVKGFIQHLNIKKAKQKAA